MKHLIAFLIFFPITTVFIISIFFEMVWHMLHAFHYEYLESIQISVPPIVEDFFLSHPALFWILKFTAAFTWPMVGFYERMKEIQDYRF